MNILDILWGTPWWVYALFVYLLIVGIKSLRPDSASLPRLLIAPTVFIIWSLYSINVKYGLSPTTVGLWALALSIGIFIGLSILSKGIKINRQNMLVHIPGSWYPLICFMIFFVLKYSLGVTYAIAPNYATNIFFWTTDILASGLISGIFVGRLVYILNNIKNL